LVIEDEKHFLYDCPLYTDLRNKYLCDLTLVGDVGNVSQVCELKHAWRLALFIYHGMKKEHLSCYCDYGTVGREAVYS